MAVVLHLGPGVRHRGRREERREASFATGEPLLPSRERFAAVAFEVRFSRRREISTAVALAAPWLACWFWLTLRPAIDRGRGGCAALGAGSATAARKRAIRLKAVTRAVYEVTILVTRRAIKGGVIRVPRAALSDGNRVAHQYPTVP